MSYQSWRKYVAEQPNFDLRVTEDPLTISFTHPGFNFCSFDRDDNIGILSLMKSVGDIRTIATRIPYNEQGDLWFNTQDATSSVLYFMSSTEFTMTPAFYDRNIPKWPLRFELSLGHLGESSYCINTKAYTADSSQLLFTYLGSTVIVDQHTRRPTPFPQWFRDKYRGKNTLKEKFRLKIFQRPEETYMYKRQVMFLDTDQNNHSNYATYVRYAIDGTHAALRHQAQVKKSNMIPQAGLEYHAASSGEKQSNPLHSEASSSNSSGSTGSAFASGARAMKGITNDILRHGIKNMQTHYINECCEGDVVDVHVWQEESEGLRVRSSIEKGSKIICQIVLDYFSPTSKL